MPFTKPCVVVADSVQVFLVLPALKHVVGLHFLALSMAM